MIYSTTLYKKFSHKAIPLSNRLERFDRFTVLPFYAKNLEHYFKNIIFVYKGHTQSIHNPNNINMKKSVTFVFDNTYTHPTGGPKVVFEYANRLVNNGWDVYIAYNYIPHSKRFYSKFYHAITDGIKYHLNKRKGILPTCKTWFALDNRVNEVFVPDINYRHIPKTSLYVATALPTAKPVSEYPIPNSRKFYFIQGYEKFGNRSDKEVRETYHYPLKKIVISQWLKEILNKEEHVSCTQIPNGFDFNKFNITEPINKKDKFCISMMYHTSPNKGCDTAFAALNLVKARYPQIKVNLFSAYAPPKDLPDWIHFTQNPDHKTHQKIYNEAAIYIAASINEGWGLTIGEAMACGAAIACTENLGFQEMVKDKKTGLLSPINNAIELGNNIIRLIEDDSLRIKLAQEGHNFIKSFSVDSSFQRLEKELLNSL